MSFWKRILRFLGRTCTISTGAAKLITTIVEENLRGVGDAKGVIEGGWVGDCNNSHPWLKSTKMDLKLENAT